jgi:hypothetical protein
MLKINLMQLSSYKGLFIAYLGLIISLFMVGEMISIDLLDATLSQVDSSMQNEPIVINSDKEFFVVDIYTDNGFAGNSTRINKNTPSLQEPFHDSISSIEIKPGQNYSDGYMVELCEHKSYAGECIILGPGSYDVESLTMLQDKIDSIRSLSPTTLSLKGLS